MSSSFKADGDNRAIGGGGSDDPADEATNVEAVERGFMPPITGGGGRPPNDFVGADAGVSLAGCVGTALVAEV